MRMLGDAAPVKQRANALARVQETGGARKRTALEIAAPLGVPILTVMLIVFFSIATPTFLTGSNIQAIFADSALPMMLAIGLTIPLVMGDFDLSLSNLAGLASTLFAALVGLSHLSPVLSIVVVLLCGLAVGLFNGIVSAYFGISAFIATIGMGSFLLGWEYPVTGSTNIYTGFPPGLVNFTRGNIGGSEGVPNLVILVGVVVILLWLLLEKTVFGRHVKAVGGNAAAARLAGVDVRRTRAIGFILCSLVATAAGILYVNKQAVAYPNSGLENQLLPAFTACFIGAATFRFGEFNILGTVVGALIVQITSNGLILLGAQTSTTYISQGVILVVALLFARVVARRRAS